MAEKKKSESVEDIISSYQKFHHKSGKEFKERIKNLRHFMIRTIYICSSLYIMLIIPFLGSREKKKNTPEHIMKHIRN